MQFARRIFRPHAIDRCGSSEYEGVQLRKIFLPHFSVSTKKRNQIIYNLWSHTSPKYEIPPLHIIRQISIWRDFNDNNGVKTNYQICRKAPAFRHGDIRQDF